jgi:hypothetical protein
VICFRLKVGYCGFGEPAFLADEVVENAERRICAQLGAECTKLVRTSLELRFMTAVIVYGSTSIGIIIFISFGGRVVTQS